MPIFVGDDGGTLRKVTDPIIGLADRQHAIIGAWAGDANSIARLVFNRLVEPVFTAYSPNALTVDLSWTPASVGGVTYEVYRQGSPNPIYVGTDLVYQDANREPNTRYVYVLLVKSMGAYHYQVYAEATTANVSVPTLTLSSSAWDRVTASWAAAASGAEYRLYRTGVTNPIYVGTALTFTDIGRRPLTQYSYRVGAFAPNGVEVIGDGPKSITTGGVANRTVTLSSPRWDRMTISWDTIAGAGFTYKVFRTGHSAALYSGTGNTMTDNGLTPGTSYEYTVKVFDGTKEVGTSVAQSKTTADYVVPTISLNSTTYENMQIRWTASEEGSVDWYELSRRSKTPTVSGWTLLESEPASDKARDESGLAENVVYEYRVRSFRNSVQIGGDAFAERTTRTRSWGTANGSHNPGYERYNDQGPNARYVMGNDLDIPSSTVYQITFWVWGFNGQAFRCEPHMADISMGNDYVFSGGQKWQAFATNCYYSAGVKTSSMRIGGPAWAWHEHYGCKRGGTGALISGFGVGQWTGWVTGANYTMPGHYPHSRNGINYDGYIATHSCNYWFYAAKEDQPEMLEKPWWDDRLDNRATVMETWPDPDTGITNKVLIKDYLTGEVLVDWERE